METIKKKTTIYVEYGNVHKHTKLCSWKKKFLNEA